MPQDVPACLLPWAPPSCLLGAAILDPTRPWESQDGDARPRRQRDPGKFGDGGAKARLGTPKASRRETEVTTGAAQVTPPARQSHALPKPRVANGPAGASYRGVRPERTLGAVLAGGPRGAGVLAEVVVAVDGGSAEVAHLGATAARHAVAAFGLDQARRALVALPNAGRGHLLFAAESRWEKGRVVVRKQPQHTTTARPGA